MIRQAVSKNLDDNWAVDVFLGMACNYPFWVFRQFRCVWLEFYKSKIFTDIKMSVKQPYNPNIDKKSKKTI